jgi:hypothetical protein
MPATQSIIAAIEIQPRPLRTFPSLGSRNRQHQDEHDRCHQNPTEDSAPIERLRDKPTGNLRPSPIAYAVEPAGTRNNEKPYAKDSKRRRFPQNHQWRKVNPGRDQDMVGTL